MRDLLLRHPRTQIIWAHVGPGRIIVPVQNHLDVLAKILDAPTSHAPA
jgi:hypothetical protein